MDMKEKAKQLKTDIPAVFLSLKSKGKLYRIQRQNFNK